MHCVGTTKPAFPRGLTDDGSQVLPNEYIIQRGDPHKELVVLTKGQPSARPSFCCTPPLPLVGVSIGIERGCQQNDRTLAVGQPKKALRYPSRRARRTRTVWTTMRPGCEPPSAIECTVFWTGWSGRSQSQRPATTAFHRGTAVATLLFTCLLRLSPRHCCCATLPFTAFTPRHCRCDRRDIVVEYPSGSFFGELEFLGFGPI